MTWRPFSALLVATVLLCVVLAEHVAGLVA
jgi:hypothetical protein